MDSVQRARRGLAVFFVMLVAASLPLEYGIAKNGLDLTLVVLLTFSPAFASVVARLVMGDGFRDISFKLDRRMWRSFSLGVLYPVVVGLPAYSLAWSLGLARFEPPVIHPLGFAVAGDGPLERMVVCAIFASTVGLLGMIPLAIGEEVGWRGFMLTRLMEARVPRPVLTSAFIWALWHVPLLASGHYIPSPNPVVSIFFFFISASGTAWVMAKLRLKTGSVWPPIVLHAAWNSIIGNFFSACTQGETAVLWASEAGALVAGCSVVTVFIWYPALFRRARRRPARSATNTDGLDLP